MAGQEPPIVFVPIASPLHDEGSTAEVLSSYRRSLRGAYDVEAVCATSPEGVDRGGLARSAGAMVLVLTGGTEHILKAVRALGRPLLVLAHDSMNSLPAALEGLSAGGGGPGARIVFGRGGRQLAEVRSFARGARTLARLSGYKIGLIGGPSPWLTYSLPDAEALAERLGIRVVEIPMEEFREVHSALRQPQGAPLGARAAGTVHASDLEKSERVYSALREIAAARGLTAVTPRCFDFINDMGATGCLALSKLNDEGIVAGCEGDVPSTVGMITMAEVSGSPAFMANPSLIDGHRLVLAHCTVAARLTRKVSYRTHFESGIGVALAGELRAGARVTVARFGERYSRLRAGAGAVVRGKPWSEELCRTQVDIRMDGDAQQLLRRPMGNHLVMAYGDQVDQLRELAAVAGLEFEEI